MIQRCYKNSFRVALIKSGHEILITFGYLRDITAVQNSKTDNFGPVNLHTQTYKFALENLVVYLLLKEHKNDIKCIKQGQGQGKYLRQKVIFFIRNHCVCTGFGMIGPVSGLVEWPTIT